jgi:hypothetical protein
MFWGEITGLTVRLTVGSQSHNGKAGATAEARSAWRETRRKVEKHRDSIGAAVHAVRD